ncbi:MAG: NADH-quinone oxidoreductase subunit A, partial [Verrucomicrobia bacterium]
MPGDYNPYLFILVMALAAIAFAATPLLLAWLWAKKFS